METHVKESNVGQRKEQKGKSKYITGQKIMKWEQDKGRQENKVFKENYCYIIFEFCHPYC